MAKKFQELWNANDRINRVLKKLSKKDLTKVADDLERQHKQERERERKKKG